MTASPWDQTGVAAYIDGRWGTTGEVLFRQWVVDDLRDRLTPGSILDAGCGSGRVYGALTEAGLLAGRGYVGVDGSTHMIALAEERYPEAEFVCADILDYRGPADNVLCIQVLQHAPNWRDILAHLLGQTRGLLYLTTWFGDGSGKADRRTGILDQWLKGDEVANLCGHYGQVQRGQITDGTLGSLFVRIK